MLFAILCLQSTYNRTKVCTPRKTLFDLTDSNYDSIIGSSRAVFVRMENEGCPYAKTSQYYWGEAANLFPNIRFVRAECISNNEICQKIGASSSPSHALFGPNSQIALDFFGNPSSISLSSTYYSDVIYRQLGFYPLDTASITELLPQSTNIFFESYKYPIFILYDSTCDEDSDFISEMVKNVTDGQISSDDYGFGRLDCSKYEEECLKWGAKVPSATIFSREKAISVSITETDNIKSRIKSVVSFLNKTQQVYPTPLPFQEPQKTPFEEIKDVKIVQIESLENREMEEIKNEYNSTKERSYNDDDYTGTADVFSCSEIELKKEAINDVLKLVNFYRKLAGIPSYVTNDETLNEGCYYAAKYSSRVGYISHSVNEIYRDSCKDFDLNWETIKSTLQRSNLAQGQINILPMISGLIDDEGANNDGVVGHRRWFLYPYLKTIGVGFYPISYQQMEGYKFQYPPSGVFSVNHDQYSTDEYEDIDFVAWPPPGPFPIERLPSSWSLYYKEFHKKDVNLSNIVLRMTRDDGKVLDCSKVDLSQENFGLSGQLVFKLNEESLGLITAGHSVHVQVYFLMNSTRDLIDYTVKFFDDKKQESICFYNEDRYKCPSSIPESRRFGDGDYDQYKGSFDQRTIIEVVEEINLTNDLNLDFSQHIIVKGSKIIGTIIIGTTNEVDINDPSSIDFVIEVDPTDLKCGILKTPNKAKSITISFTKEPSMKIRSRSLFYIGSYTQVDLPQRVSSGDYIYFYGLSYKGTETYLVCTPIINAEYFCNGAQHYYEDYIDSSINCNIFSELSELSKFKTEKKIVKIFSDGIIEISQRVFPNNNFADYYFYLSNSLTLEYSPVLEQKARVINITAINGRTLNPTIRFSQIPYGIPILYNEALKNVFPFKNLYISNVSSSIIRKEYLIPDLLGDEESKRLFEYNETEVYNESESEFADSSGAYKYPEKSYNSGTFYNPLFITNGLHDEYSFSRSEDDGNVNLRLQPTDSSSSKHVTFKFISPKTISTSVFQNIFIQNYKDVTIMAESHLLGNYFQSIKLINVSKARFEDFNGKPVTGIITDVIGNSYIDLSSSSKNPVTFREMFFRSNSEVECMNSRTNQAIVVESNPTIKNLEIKNLYLVYSTVNLLNCSVNDIVEFYCYYGNVPTIRIKDNSTFNPSVISIIIYDSYLFSKSILALKDDLSLLISGLNPNISDSILSKISFYDSFNQPLENYKVVLTKDKKGFYLVDDDFDESNTPDSVLIGDDDISDDDLVFDDIKYEINDPPPNVYLNKDNKKNKLSTGAIIGIVVGCVVAVALIVILIVFLVIRHKKENNQTISEDEGKEIINDDSTGL